jgi:hypothetical protein
MPRTLAAALLAMALMPARAHALENEDVLALVAMPLAVAAVTEMTEVSESDLMDVVTLMNDAEVSPAQFIEVVRYAPAALVGDRDQPRFAQFIQDRYDEGMRGPTLVNSIEERIRIYGIHGVDLDVEKPRIVDVGPNFIPRVVRTQLVERRAHPHGGPPGLMKKQLGARTGADLAHRGRPKDRGKGRDRG